MQQWFDEFEKHAPDVTVIRYEGWKKLEANFKKTMPTNGIKDDPEEVDMEKPAKSFIRHIIDSNVEVVITDFISLQADFNVRLPPPKRPRRDGIDYMARSEQPRSPIVAMHWWRLIIDETQLADPAGTTKVAETMRVILRTYSLAVSGTPAKANTSDLYGSLHFIGLPLNSRQWQNLQRNYFLPAFVNLFERVCIRTTKKQLKGSHGLQEPPAKYIVPVELTPVEMQVRPRHEYCCACRMAKRLPLNSITSRRSKMPLNLSKSRQMGFQLLRHGISTFQSSDRQYTSSVRHAR